MRLATDRERAISPFLWALLGELLAKGLPALLLLALTHWLAPSAMGVALLTAAVVSLAQLLAEAGLGRALVMQPAAIPEQSTTVFWINLVLSAALCLALMIAAPLIATAFGTADVASAIRVQSLGIPVIAAAGVHLALLQKHLRFRALAAVRGIGAITPLLVALPMAIAGYGYWSLVTGALVGAVAQTLSAVFAERWRPQGRPALRQSAPLLRYGFWITTEVMLGWSLLWLDALLVGGALGVTALGVYRTGSQIALLFFGVTLGSMLPVYFALFAALRGQPADLARSVVRANQAFVLIGIPLTLTLWFGSRLGVDLIMGSGWQQTATVLAWIGLSQGMAWSVSANVEALKASGRARLNAGLVALSLGVYALTLSVAAVYGLESAARARCLATAILVPMHWLIAARVLEIPIRTQLGVQLPPIAAGFTAFVAGMLVTHHIHLEETMAEGRDVLATLTALLAYVLLVWRSAKRWLQGSHNADRPSNQSIFPA
ncbi:MAG: oligosaccharide flippase family protein [Pseudomonadota bacterium]